MNKTVKIWVAAAIALVTLVAGIAIGHRMQTMKTEKDLVATTNGTAAAATTK